MRSSKVVLAAAVAALCACGGGQPRTYRVAINQSALEALIASCYNGGVAPTTTVTTTNAVISRDWSLWDGLENKLYLDVGTHSWNMGDAVRVEVGTGSGSSLSAVIEGSGKTFTEAKQTQYTSIGRTDLREVTVTFDETPGATMKGTIHVKASTTCTGCSVPNCEATFTFVGRKIEGQTQINYGG